MRIQHNISALNTYRQMGANNTGAAKSLEKLSSGYRINRAGDDAAGLAISEKMRAQINGLNRASANAQDGVSLIQAAEGALQETHSILQRMRELAVQAANDVNETEDRKAIQDELNQLTKEVDRIAYTTEFNKKTLLDGSLLKDAVSAKTVSGSGVATGLVASAGLAAGLYNVEVTTAGVQQKAEFLIDTTGATEGATISIEIGGTAIQETGADADTDLIAVDSKLVIFQATGDVDKDNATAVNMLKDALTKSIDKYYDVTSVDNKIIITEKQANGETGALEDVTFTINDQSTTPGTPIPVGAEIEATNFVEGATAELTLTGPDASISFTVEAGAKYGTFIASADDAGSLSFALNDVTKYAAAVVKVSTGRELTLQVGANEGIDQTIGIGIRNLSASGLGIDNLTVHSNEAGRAALSAINTAIVIVSDQRAALGAVQSRLEHTSANLDTVAENLQNAEGRIRDVDMAKEMMNFTKFNILMQASQAMMAQANSQPQGVLQLLR